MKRIWPILVARKVIIGAVILFFLPSLLQAQWEPLYFNRLSVADNLTSQSYNYYVFLDSKGFIWISSIDGLNRFDGRRVKPYRHQDGDPLSLASDNVQGLFFEDAAGDLWFCTSEAVHRYDRLRDSFEQRKVLFGGEPLTGVYQLLFLDKTTGELWVSVDNKLYVDYIDRHDTPKFLGDYRMNFLSRIIKTESPDPEYLLIQPRSNSNSLQIFRFQDYQVVDSANYLGERLPADVRVNAFLWESGRRIWVGNNLGLIALDLPSGEYVVYDSFEDRPVRDVVGIVPYSPEELIVATRKSGIFIFNRAEWKFTHQLHHYQEESILPFQVPVEKIHLDVEGNLWVSSNGRGVYYTNLKKRKFKTALQSYSGSATGANNVRAMTQDPEGRIWCLTWDGIAILDKHGNPDADFSRYYGNKAPFAGSQPFDLLCDQKGRIWAASLKGLYVRLPEDDQFRQVFPPTPLKLPGFIYLYQLGNGRILASAHSGGIFEVQDQPQGIKLFPLPEIKISSGINSIFESKDGRIFCSNFSNSIDIYRQQGHQIIADTSLAFKPVIHALIEDTARQCFWIATSSGLYQLNAENAEVLIQPDSIFPNQVINGLLLDSAGFLWASTDQGLARYHPDSGNYRSYEMAEGLQSEEFNFFSYLKTQEGRFAFGGVNGINLFNPMKINDLQLKARPMFTEVLIGDVPANDLKCDETGATNINLIKKLDLPFRRNTLTLYFAPLEYSDPKACTFKYQLEGQDTGFVFNGTTNFVRFPDLPPKKYTLKVFASNSDGVWSNHPATIEIIIHPPWYQTRWFLSLVALAFIGTILGVYRFRVNQIRKKEAFKRKELEFKQKEAEFKQQVAETETAILRLQMNPHFIFNSLNSISRYILNRDPAMANDYLTRFARLMRRILNLAAQPRVDLSDEIELLEQYLETEKMRFEKGFDYSFEVDEMIDLDDTLLPTMLLQPFVENAIWHGLSGKKEKGRIRIGFAKDGEQLLCFVEDNGAGRSAATEKKAGKESHESKALKITTRRLKLLKEETGHPTSLQFIDLYDDTGQPAGTRVEVRIPFL